MEDRRPALRDCAFGYGRFPAFGERDVIIKTFHFSICFTGE
jgi:hypothetical protein